MSRTAKFWDRMAAGYIRRPVKDEESYQKKLELTRGYLQPEMEVLEFGCGSGATAIAHARSVKHIKAIDISGNMLDVARRSATDANVQNITFLKSTIDGFEAPDESFDVVLGLSILHLLPNKEAAISKVYKMLKPGGVFVSSTICMADSSIAYKVATPIARLFGLVLRAFTAANLKTAMTGTGFVIEHEWRPGAGKAIFLIAKKPS
jgi:ubiquinone/menaquinone biosynthesis C-methylase UbiE